MEEDGHRTCQHLVHSWTAVVRGEGWLGRKVLVTLPCTRQGAPWVRQEDAEQQQAVVFPVLEVFPKRTPPLAILQSAVRLFDHSCGLSGLLDPEQQELWALRQAFLLRLICMKVRTALSQIKLARRNKRWGARSVVFFRSRFAGSCAHEVARAALRACSG